ncbi:Bug family tripartite tricarboxylate transporter substrate binding protein [Candidimonas humi]|uniref:Bug family tripartite tricarboxylate transporter substrate binding protein n=1 Tax=Candidimonas humi TaxID=683355 RepID=A0ABV8NZ43_9BURK|nr:tripartite tricarboxylate transporter substrate binding protein [Candidimonas humi]
MSHSDHNTSTASIFRPASRRPASRRRMLGASAALLLPMLLPASGWAAGSYPSKAVTLVVPYTPGGPTDIVGRALGQALSQKWGQSVIIENRPGAGGNIGSAYVARSAPDGYTLVLGVTGSHAINKWLYKSLPYDPQKDFAAVSLAVVYSNVIVANPKFPANNLKELVALAQKNPGKYSYGSDGNGSASHLSMELLKERGKFNIVHVPYRGSAPLLNDVVGGTIPLGITGLPSAGPLIEGGKLKVIGLTTAKDYSGHNYPTIESQGFPDFDIAPFSAVFAPKGTPSAIVDKISADIRDVMSQPAMKERMAKLGLMPMPTTPEETQKFLAKQIAEWQKAVKISGASIN